MNNSLTLINVSKKYNTKRVLNNFSYNFKCDCIYAVVGNSGIGKSTLLSIIAKQINYQGTIYFNNINIKTIKDFTFLNVGYVMQSYQLFDKLTAFENVALYFILKNENIDLYRYKIYTLFKQFNIYECLNVLVKNLSGGQKQRIAIIKTLIKNPDILLLDEPTSALDEISKNLLFSYLKTIKKEKIIIIVTHDQKLANLCDSIIDLKNSYTTKEDIKDVRNNLKLKTKIYKIKELYTKVFKAKKIFLSMATSILIFGLTSLIISTNLSSFIQKFTQKIVTSIRDDNIASFISQYTDDEIQIDIKDGIMYQSFDSSKLKNEKIINKISINNKIIPNNYFIFDNYFTKNKNKITLSLPTSFYLPTCNNYLFCYIGNKEFKILLDEIIYNDENDFIIYSNDISYLTNIFNYLKINVEIANYVYSENIDSLYNYLINDKRYLNYSFIKYDNTNIIQIIKQINSRIDLNTLNNLYSMTESEFLIYSDFIYTYIDYASQFYYVKYDNEMIQAKIDNTLTNNYIKVSQKLVDTLGIYDLIVINNKAYEVIEITSENTYPILYINSQQFNNLSNKENIYAGILFNFKKGNIYFDNLLINYTNYTEQKFEVFDYISEFLYYFSFLLLLLAFIAFYVVFNVNFESKRKDFVYLYKIGIYKNDIVKIMSFDAFKCLKNVIICIVIINFMIPYIFMFLSIIICHENIELTYDLNLFLKTIILPVLIIFITIFAKVIYFFKNNK